LGEKPFIHGQARGILPFGVNKSPLLIADSSRKAFALFGMNQSAGGYPPDKLLADKK
jgi:hypothetical protein